MKKLLVVMMSFIMIFSACALSASAATPAEQLKSAVLDAVPEKHRSKIEVSVDNLLSQVTVTEDQLPALLNLVDESKTVVAKDKGLSLHNYPKEEQKVIMAELTKACDILDISYKITSAGSSSDKTHTGDVVVNFYNNSGEKILDIDFDEVSDTGSAYTPVNVVLVAVIAVVLVAGFATFAVSNKSFKSKKANAAA